MLRLGHIQPIPCKRLGEAKTRLPKITGQFHPSGNLGPATFVLHSNSNEEVKNRQHGSVVLS